jgi:hypothetical protein
MRFLPFLLAPLVLVAPASGRSDPTPVVLELFTSQGCSSCPPADELLTTLAQQDGVIALALHVDYWDYLGWKDSFGKPKHTARQKAYAKAARSCTIYTPEMVVQGRERLKGHDAATIVSQIAAHQQEPAPVTLTLEREGDALEIGLAPAGPAAGPADVHLVRYLPEEEVSIAAGENAGRTLVYSNIVSDWETIMQWDGAAPVEFRYEAAGEGPLAVIVQGARMGPVLAAGKLP